MSVVFNAATAANVSILQQTNSLFQTSQKRVSTGKMIFGAADDATRYKMSQSMLSRSRQLDSVNNNISLTLKTLEATDKTLTAVIGLVESAQTLARKAQAEGGIPTITTTGATSLALGANTVVVGAVLGSKFQITSDNGKTATYTFGANFAATTWGEIANSINAQNIGVKLDFVPGVGTAAQLQLSSTDGTTGFKIDGLTDRNVVDDIGAITSGTGEVYSTANMFTAGIVAPTIGQEGFAIGNGGVVTTVGTALLNKTTAVPASTATVPQSVSFVGSDGIARTWTNGTTATTSQGFVDQINAMNAGVKAEFVNAGGANVQVRLRNTAGGEMKILSASGVFASGTTPVLRFSSTIGQSVITGPAGPSTSNTANILKYGAQYDAILANITLQIANNPVQTGRNLLAGQSTSVVLDEFSGTPITISGTSVSLASLGLTSAGATWGNSANIQTSATQSNGAIITLRNMQGEFSTFNSYMQERYDLNKSYGTDLKTLGDDLVAADVSEESAKLSALQTQQQFAVQAFSMGSQNAQGLLRLLG